MKLKLGNLMSGKNKYYTIGAVTLGGVFLTAIMRRMIKQDQKIASPLAARGRAMSRRSSINTRNQPGMLDEDWPTTWLPEPFIERKTDKMELNKLPLMNITPTPIRLPNRFIGGSGFETSCNTGISKQWY
jgi:hypothetical protein